ncbi:MAG: S8 family serine peptidase [Dehalococcoidales bacterium]|nr:S8 family serine peptidase [Dehalococcoidales bacterium]
MNKKLLVIMAAVLALVTSLVGPMAAMAQPPEMVRVLIGFNLQPGPNEEAVVRGAGGDIRYTYSLVPAIAASVPETAIQGLLRNPRVTVVEPVIEVHAIDAELDNTWGVKRISAGDVHDGGNTGAGVKVAIIDSGIDYTHPDLNANYTGGYDFVNSDNDPRDDYGHGTHVAGTVAALKNSTGVVGVAPEASTYGLKVLSASGSGSYDDVIAALEWAVANGIQVTNNSYGSSGNPGTLVKAAFDNSYNAGVLHVAAAGNNGNAGGKADNVGYPARWASVIAVAATDQSDKRASFSSTGPDLELAAPGVKINSTKLGGGYIEYNGTSMASPHVAGAAALIIASGIADTNGNGLINDEVRLRLQQTADDLGPAGKDSHYGYGLVNAANAAPGPPVSGVIQGTVADGTNPVSGASVTDGTRTATTDTNGNYSINNVPDGTYTVTASASGYHSAWQEATVADGGTTTVDIVLTIIQNGAISGNVNDSDTGQPIAGATVTDGTRTATTDSDGNYTISDVPPASYSVTASADGYQGASQTVSVQEGGTTSGVNFALSPTTEATAVSISSITYYTEGGRNRNQHLRIAATLVDDLGNPVAGTSISIAVYRNGGLYASGTGTTGTDGKVTFKAQNAPSGTYTTTVTNVNATGWDGFTPENSFTK